jgi:four helix bundle suffix protein
MRNLGRTHSDSEFFINIAESRNAETIANMAIILITQADSLTYKYIEYMGREFEDNGGFSEKLTRIRIEKRNK